MIFSLSNLSRGVAIQSRIDPIAVNTAVRRRNCMSALERINNAYLELLSASTIGNLDGNILVNKLRENCHLITKVYIPDETIEHWFVLSKQETLTVQKISFMVKSSCVHEFLQLIGFEPDCIFLRKMNLEEPYHSIIINVSR